MGKPNSKSSSLGSATETGNGKGPCFSLSTQGVRSERRVRVGTKKPRLNEPGGFCVKKYSVRIARISRLFRTLGVYKIEKPYKNANGSSSSGGGCEGRQGDSPMLKEV